MGELDWRLLDERPGPAGYLSITTRQYLLPDGTRSHWDILGGGRLASYASIERYALIAEGCRFTADPTPDAEEFCQTVLLSHDEFVAHVRSGELTDTDIAYMCLDNLDREALKRTSVGRWRPPTAEQLD